MRTEPALGLNGAGEDLSAIAKGALFQGSHDGSLAFAVAPVKPRCEVEWSFEPLMNADRTLIK
jgi:hypothetical protein